MFIIMLCVFIINPTKTPISTESLYAAVLIIDLLPNIDIVQIWSFSHW